MMKQEKVVPFCYNCDVGQDVNFNIVIQHIYLYLSLSVYLAGQYIPFCDEDGYYKPSQCHGSLGQCWCVDRYGNEVSGSRTNGAAECGKLRIFCAVWFRAVIPFDCPPGLISSVRSMRPSYVDFDANPNKICVIVIAALELLSLCHLLIDPSHVLGIMYINPRKINFLEQH